MNNEVKKIDNSFSSVNKEEIATVSGKDISFLENIVRSKEKYYIEKQLIRNAKTQIIHPSILGLKSTQRLIVDYLSENIKFPPCAHGSIKHKSTKTNAKIHRGKKYVLAMDIKNFFPSITKNMVLNNFLAHGMNIDTAKLATELFTYKGTLQIGPPSSPFVANLVLMPLDLLVQRFCKKHKLKYTRYMDDISISGNKTLHPYFGTIKKYINQYGFELAYQKTQFMERDRPQVVTKIVVNEKIGPIKKYISDFRKEIRERWTGSQREDIDAFKKRAWGKIAYIKQYNKRVARELRGLLVKIPK